MWLISNILLCDLTIISDGILIRLCCQNVSRTWGRFHKEIRTSPIVGLVLGDIKNLRLVLSWDEKLVLTRNKTSEINHRSVEAVELFLSTNIPITYCLTYYLILHHINYCFIFNIIQGPDWCYVACTCQLFIYWDNACPSGLGILENILGVFCRLVYDPRLIPILIIQEPIAGIISVTRP